MANPTIVRNFSMTEVAEGHVPGHSLIHKFGAADLTTTMRTITQTGVYQTPTSVVALEFVSSDINDTAAGSGAQEITVIGINSLWEEETIVKETNGTVAVPLGTSLFRVHRWYVSRSGTYATSTTSSHAGVLSLQVLGGGTVWDSIPIAPIASGQSLISAYTVPTGVTAFLMSKQVFVDSNKSADVYFFHRDKADDVVAPYTGIMRLIEREVGLSGTLTMDFAAPKGPFVGPCDVGFFGKVTSGTADCSAEFELLIVENDYIL